MNCRQGDLAVIVRSTDPAFESNVGALVEVVELYSIDPAAWAVKSLGRQLLGRDPVYRNVFRYSPDVAVLDSVLRPLRGQEPDEIRELQPHELEAVSVTTASGIARWPR